jgi:tripartite-type tricarboxylate transporter receptor subunit TctC
MIGSLALGLSGAAAAEDYFKGKSIRIIVGTPPGGGYDAYGRLVARHLGGFIPGNPSVVASNLPGASGLKAATYLQTVAPKDGTVIATFNKSMPLYQALGQVPIELKTEQLSYIGSVSQTSEVLSVWHKTGVKTIEDAKTREVLIGADAATGTMAVYPTLLNATVGTKFKIITGYAGGNAVNMAMEQGEVDGRGTTTWSSLKSTKPQWARDGLIVPLVQVGLRREPDLPNVPLLIELGQNDEQRSMFRAMSAPIALERLFAGPPGMDREVLTILRDAFERMLKDPTVLAEAARQGMDINPRTGDDVAKIVSEILATPAPVIQKIKDITGVKDGEATKE